MTFSEKLVTLRKDSGMSQDALAEKLGVSRQAVSKWELGTAMPETKNIVQLAEIFGVRIDYMMNYIPHSKTEDLKYIFKKYSSTFYFVLYELFTFTYMLCLAHLSVVAYSIIKHTFGGATTINGGTLTKWNFNYIIHIMSVNADNIIIALLIGALSFLLTRYIRKKDGNNNDNR